jgi:hypothetical protein
MEKRLILILSRKDQAQRLRPRKEIRKKLYKRSQRRRFQV